MNILCLDTSTSLASVAVCVGGTIAAESVFSTDRTLSSRLLPEIERLLSIAGLSVAGIDLFACAVGPGSFTGIRAGIATTQGLALAMGKPCAGFSSLTLLALNFPLSAHPVCTLLDARKGEIYGALFDCSSPHPVTLIHDCVMPPEQFLDELRETTGTSVIFAGEGVGRYQDVICERMGSQSLIAPFPHHAGHSANGALLALEMYRTGRKLEPAQLLPVYLRASEAEYAKMDRQTTRISKMQL